jgi:hypothetical protein
MDFNISKKFRKDAKIMTNIDEIVTPVKKKTSTSDLNQINSIDL